MGVAHKEKGAIDLHRSISVILNRLDLNFSSPHPGDCGNVYRLSTKNSGVRRRLWGVDSRMSQRCRAEYVAPKGRLFATESDKLNGSLI